ncbi:hypothetical protein LCGC14_1232690, partial [marine sediment metagenome]
TDKVDIPDTPGLDFEVEKLYEEEGSSPKNNDSKLITVKGIGKGTVEGLGALGILSVNDLVKADPDDLSSKLSGASTKTVLEWQKNAKTLIEA